MEDEKVTFGLRLESVIEHGYRRVRAVLMRRRDTDAFPVNPICLWANKEMAMDGLRLSASISDYDGKYYLDKPGYSGVFAIDLARAKAMVAMLGKITKAIEKAKAIEAGDVLMQFAKAAGATWVCIPLETDARYSSYRDTKWNWMSLAQGRDQFRFMIGQAEEEQRRVGIRKSA